MSTDEMMDTETSFLQAHEIKKEPVDAGSANNKDSGKFVTGNLFTSEGLQASYRDLEQLFDNDIMENDISNDETVMIFN